MIQVKKDFKNLPIGLKIPDGDLCIFTGPNNSGKSALLQYINCETEEEIKSKCDYISPKRFDHSNDVTIDRNFVANQNRAYTKRKKIEDNTAEINAPDATMELLSLPDDIRKNIIKWHNQYFGELKVEKSREDNIFAPPVITIDGLTVSQQGSGSRLALSILCALLHPDREILLIDEPEMGLEPQVQKRLFNLIKKVSKGENKLKKKQIYIATHSHLFLDRENISNNYIVTKDGAGKAEIAGVNAQEELHSLVFNLLGNSPGDIFFPENILIVEGISDNIFLSRILELLGDSGIAVHYAEGDGNISKAVSAIDQMLKTQSYIPLYRDRICILVDKSVPEKRIDEWKTFLTDDGTRVKQLSKNGIEYFYPKSIVASVCKLHENGIDSAIDKFLESIRRGSPEAKLGEFFGSKKGFASSIAQELEKEHIEILDPEIINIIEVVRKNKFNNMKDSSSQ